MKLLPFQSKKSEGEGTTSLYNATGAHKFIFDTIVVAIAQLLLKLRGLVALFLIVKLMGTAQYGIWAQILAFVSLISGVLGGNLHLPLVHFIAEDQSSARLPGSFHRNQKRPRVAEVKITCW